MITKFWNCNIDIELLKKYLMEKLGEDNPDVKKAPKVTKMLESRYKDILDGQMFLLYEFYIDKALNEIRNEK
jgi:hypothetical protein